MQPVYCVLCSHGLDIIFVYECDETSNDTAAAAAAAAAALVDYYYYYFVCLVGIRGLNDLIMFNYCRLLPSRAAVPAICFFPFRILAND